MIQSRSVWQGKIMKSLTSSATDSDSSPTPMDVQDALSRLGNDRELLSGIIEIYLEDSPALLEKIRRAVMGNDPSALQRAAHSLKGLAATLSAEDVTAAARRLESMGASSSLSDAVPAVAQLETLLSELNAAAQRYIKDPR